MKVLLTGGTGFLGKNVARALAAAGHSLRVQKFARYMGLQLGFRGKRLAQLEQHALMHDIGKLAVPNHVLRKPGRLDEYVVEAVLALHPYELPEVLALPVFAQHVPYRDWVVANVHPEV